MDAKHCFNSCTIVDVGLSFDRALAGFCTTTSLLALFRPSLRCFRLSNICEWACVPIFRFYSESVTAIRTQHHLSQSLDWCGATHACHSYLVTERRAEWLLVVHASHDTFSNSVLQNGSNDFNCLVCPSTSSRCTCVRCNRTTTIATTSATSGVNKTMSILSADSSTAMASLMTTSTASGFEHKSTATGGVISPTEPTMNDASLIGGISAGRDCWIVSADWRHCCLPTLSI